jgi:hypothetical protein
MGQGVFDEHTPSSRLPHLQRAPLTAFSHAESECHSPYCILNLDTTGLKLNNFSAYNARWHMPSPESGGVLSMWYSWSFSNVHFVSIDTSTDFPDAPEGKTGDGHFAELPAGSFAPNGTYMAWLEADLTAAASDPHVQWIVVGGHRPFEDLPDAHVADLVRLFKTYGVAFYFAGHGHSAARFPADAWGDGTVHYMAGGAGCDEMPFPADQWKVGADGGEDSAEARCMAWCEAPATRAHAEGTDPCRYCVHHLRAPPTFTSDQMAIGLLSATPSALTFSLLRAPDGAVLDTVTVTK